jgi:acetyltransferase-like isoleucine patch superfamily enzyme
VAVVQGELRTSDLAPNLLLGGAVELGDGVTIGANVVIHSPTSVEGGVWIGDGAVIGSAPVVGPRSSATCEAPPAAEVGRDARLLTGCVVLAGARIGTGAIVGDQAHVRERSVIGAESVVGRGSAIDNDVQIGSRVRIQTNCYVTAFSVIEDDVFVGPGVTTTNDNTMARIEPTAPLTGVTLRRACRIGGGVVLCPGVEIGEEAFVAAGAVVATDVDPGTVVMGVPARPVRTVPEEDALGHWQ